MLKPVVRLNVENDFVGSENFITESNANSVASEKGQDTIVETDEEQMATEEQPVETNQQKLEKSLNTENKNMSLEIEDDVDESDESPVNKMPGHNLRDVPTDSQGYMLMDFEHVKRPKKRRGKMSDTRLPKLYFKSTRTATTTTSPSKNSAGPSKTLQPLKLKQQQDENDEASESGNESDEYEKRDMIEIGASCMYCKYPYGQKVEASDHSTVCKVKRHHIPPVKCMAKWYEFYLTCTFCGATTAREFLRDMMEHLKTEHKKKAIGAKTYTLTRLHFANWGEIVGDPDYKPPIAKETTKKNKQLRRTNNEDRGSSNSEADESSGEQSSSSNGDRSPRKLKDEKRIKHKRSREPSRKMGRKHLGQPGENANSDDESFVCKLCSHKLVTNKALKNHLQAIHEIKDKKVLNLVQKFHLLDRKKGHKTRYICHECYVIFDRKRRHGDDHKPTFQMFQDYSELPDFLVKHAKFDCESSDDYFLTKCTYNFQSLLDEYKQRKLREYELGLTRQITPENVKGKLENLRRFIKMTEGMTKAERIDDWILSYSHKRAAKTHQNTLMEARNFIKSFLVPKFGRGKRFRNGSEVEFTRLIEELDRLKMRGNKSVKIRKEVNKVALSNTLPKPSEIQKLRERCFNFLKENLKDTDQTVSHSLYRDIICCLIALIVIRNNSRTCTVTQIRAEYLEDIDSTFSSELKLYVIQLVPKEIADIKKGYGERSKLSNIEKILQVSHKNFYCEGVKAQSIDKTEKELIESFKRLRTTMKVTSVFFFSPSEDENISWEMLRSKLKHWSDRVKRLFGFGHLNWNATLHRQLMATCWRMMGLNGLTKEALLRHTGHSAATAEKFYEVDLDKNKDAMICSTIIDALLHFPKSDENAARTLEVLAKLVASNSKETQSSIEEAEEISQPSEQQVGSLKKRQARRESLSSGGELDSPKLFQSDAEIEEDASSDAERGAEADDEGVQKTTTLSQTNVSSQLVYSKIEGTLKDQITHFILNRPNRRPGRQKFTMTADIASKVAALYIAKNENKLKSLKAAVENSDTALSLENVRSIFTQVDKYFNL